jgi:hypothetical protein
MKLVVLKMSGEMLDVVLLGRLYEKMAREIDAEPTARFRAQ